MKVITFSRYFPVKHPKAGQPTYFVEKIWKGLWDTETSSHNPVYPQWLQYDQTFPCKFEEKENIHNHAPKWHTIRAGNRWKIGDQFSPRVWSGKPYQSKQIEIAPPITIEKIWGITIEPDSYGEGLDILIDGEIMVGAAEVNQLALNDGLAMADFFDWFNVHPKKKKQIFTGQILCWNPNINY